MELSLFLCSKKQVEFHHGACIMQMWNSYERQGTPGRPYIFLWKDPLSTWVEIENVNSLSSSLMPLPCQASSLCPGSWPWELAISFGDELHQLNNWNKYFYIMGYNEFKGDVERSYEKKVPQSRIFNLLMSNVCIWTLFLYGLLLRERSFISSRGFIVIMLKDFLSGL